jgi:lysylphosphatidylglycerol synthetase-like protein (DUF2156 family)
MNLKRILAIVALVLVGIFTVSSTLLYFGVSWGGATVIITAVSGGIGLPLGVALWYLNSRAQREERLRAAQAEAEAAAERKEAEKAAEQETGEKESAGKGTGEKQAAEKANAPDKGSNK